VNNVIKRVYLPMSAEVIHFGHINIINEAAKLGDVTIGLLTDSAIAKFAKVPYLTFEQRKLVIQNIKGVENVIAQETPDFELNVRTLRPDYFVHGDVWRKNNSISFRNKVISLMDEIGGKLVEIPYTQGISSALISETSKSFGTTPSVRLGMLRRLIASKPLITINEVHNGLTGLITEYTTSKRNGIDVEFDAMWSSSLTDSTAKGMPDIEAVDITSRISSVNHIFEVTTKPMIFDGDTGGKIEHFAFTVRSLERIGVSAIVIEDKVGLKKNSLFGNDVEQTQDTIEAFSEKIQVGKNAQITDDFMIIARIESLILGAGMDDALRRAEMYIESGADAIMIHSREKLPDEIFEFCNKFHKLQMTVPLMVVPSSFNTVTEKEWVDKGVSIVCYANHMLRAAYPAMLNVSKSILKYGRTYEAEEGKKCMPIKEILDLIPGTR
jgi:phosphoenolpyruvate phosphomutase / 2-hydroxyethylphosphonate cytidylyltransferase